MSESFSDPSRLNGVEVSGEPLADYYEVADQTYSGNMLSQNYGGGTANIEFEALTGFLWRYLMRNSPPLTRCLYQNGSASFYRFSVKRTIIPDDSDPSIQYFDV